MLLSFCTVVFILSCLQKNVESYSLLDESSDELHNVTENFDAYQKFSNKTNFALHWDFNELNTQEQASFSEKDTNSVEKDMNKAVQLFGMTTSNSVLTPDVEKVTDSLRTPELLKGNDIKDENQILIHKIVENIDIVCLTGRVCRNTSIKDAKPGFRHCCEECSCESDCKSKNQTCCFQSNSPKYFSDYIVEECNFLTTSLIEKSQRHTFLSYKMETKCPYGTGGNVINSTVGITCGDETVAPWGSYHPVYSEYSHKLYKNKACALCNGVTDGIEMDAIMVCSVFSHDGRRQNIGNFESFLNGFDYDNLCYVNFNPSVPYSALSHLKCLQDPIETCPDNDFPLPDGITMSKEQVVQACKSTFTSYYSMFGAYKNAFCHICNNESWSEERACMPLLAYPRYDSQAKFTTLLSRSFLKKTSNAKSNKKDLSFACVTTKDLEQVCRQTYCPEGKTNDGQGNCIFPTSRWNIGTYQLILKLIPEKNIPDIYIQDNMIIGKSRSIFDMSKLVSPFPNIWTLQTFSYRTQDNDSSLVDHFIATVRTSFLPKNPDSVLKAVSRFMERKWYLTINDTPVGLHVEFSGMRDFLIQGEIFKPNFYDNFNNTFPINGLTWKILLDYVSLNPISSLLTITEMFYCNQIALQEDEYVMGHKNNVLQYKNNYYLDGEFSYVIDIHTGTYIPRVCVEITGFTKQNKNGMSSQKKAYSFCLVSAILMYLAFFASF